LKHRTPNAHESIQWF